MQPLNKLFISCFLLLTAKPSKAQNPEELLSRWAQTQPIEKVYLHFDRDKYAAGETAWLKAYLSADYLPDTISTTLYVELVNKDQLILGRKVLPVLAGTSAGHMEIPDSLETGVYTVRAFTASMALTMPDFIFKKGLYVHGKKSQEPSPVNQPGVKLFFFPEGGNLVAGFNGTVAFKAADASGLPVDISGVVKNSKGKEQCSFNSYHDGMGMFELRPEAGEQYYAETGAGRFDLPEVMNKGIVFTVMPHPQGNFFEIQQKTSDPDFMAAYMIGQMQHRVVFRQEFKNHTASLQGVINTEKLMSGVLQVTVFNKNGIPLAERLCFVNNKEYLLPVELLTDTINTAARSRNRFRIVLRDTVQGSLSVSVTDAEYAAPGEENILTSLLLTSDLKGYVYRPVYYFSADSDSVKTATDLLMMTHGWRRFKWTELSTLKATASSKSAFISLSGKVTLRNSSKPFDSKTLLLMINNPGSKKARTSQIIETDKNGNFLIDSLIFFNKNLLLFTDTRGKKSQYIDVSLNNDSLHKYFAFPGFTVLSNRAEKSVEKARWQDDYEALLKANGLLLEEIKIKVQKKTPMQQVDDRYTSGMFSGEATKAIDLVSTDEALNYNNIFDYLQNRVNGLQIVANGPEYGVFYRQGPTISSMGNIPMTLFLDEIETDVSVIATIPANQVALVKIYNTFAGAWGNAPGGVLAIYTKKGEDFTADSKFANTIIYNGYSVIKEFYAPDYKKDNNTDSPDNRITLDWRPSIFVNNVNPRIPVSFYNNDRTKSFKIVVEGMTTAGKLIFLEKTISGVK